LRYLLSHSQRNHGIGEPPNAAHSQISTAFMEGEPTITITDTGPSGLVTALTLVQEGRKVAIYDALSKSLDSSRAAGVHAHMLEVMSAGSFKFPSNVIQQLISRGIEGKSAAQCTIIQTSFAKYLRGLTEYPFAPQHKVEHFLEERLN
jgi:FAD binding domain